MEMIQTMMAMEDMMVSDVTVNHVTHFQLRGVAFMPNNNRHPVHHLQVHHLPQVFQGRGFIRVGKGRIFLQNECQEHLHLDPLPTLPLHHQEESHVMLTWIYHLPARIQDLHPLHIQSLRS